MARLTSIHTLPRHFPTAQAARDCDTLRQRSWHSLKQVAPGAGLGLRALDLSTTVGTVRGRGAPITSFGNPSWRLGWIFGTWLAIAPWTSTKCVKRERNGDRVEAPPARFSRLQGCVNRMKWNADGSLLLSGSDDLRLIVWGWDPSGGLRPEVDEEDSDYSYAADAVSLSMRPRAVVHTEHHQNIFGVQFMPCSGDDIIASCAMDGQVQLHTMSRQGSPAAQHRLRAEVGARPGKVATRVLYSHRSSAKALEVAPLDPNMLWSAGDDGRLLQIDLRSPEAPLDIADPILESYYPGLRPLTGVACNPVNPNFLAISAKDGFCRVLDRRYLPRHMPRSIIPSEVFVKGSAPDVEGAFARFAPFDTVPMSFFMEKAGARSPHRAQYAKAYGTHIAWDDSGQRIISNYSNAHVYSFDAFAHPHDLSVDVAAAAADDALHHAVDVGVGRGGAGVPPPVPSSPPPPSGQAAAAQLGAESLEMVSACRDHGFLFGDKDTRLPASDALQLAVDWCQRLASIPPGGNLEDVGTFPRLLHPAWASVALPTSTTRFPLHLPIIPDMPPAAAAAFKEACELVGIRDSVEARTEHGSSDGEAGEGSPAAHTGVGGEDNQRVLRIDTDRVDHPGSLWLAEDSLLRAIAHATAALARSPDDEACLVVLSHCWCALASLQAAAEDEHARLHSSVTAALRAIDYGPGNLHAYILLVRHFLHMSYLPLAKRVCQELLSALAALSTQLDAAIQALSKWKTEPTLTFRDGSQHPAGPVLLKAKEHLASNLVLARAAAEEADKSLQAMVSGRTLSNTAEFVQEFGRYSAIAPLTELESFCRPEDDMATIAAALEAGISDAVAKPESELFLLEEAAAPVPKEFFPMVRTRFASRGGSMPIVALTGHVADGSGTGDDADVERLVSQATAQLRTGCYIGARNSETDIKEAVFWGPRRAKPKLPHLSTHQSARHGAAPDLQHVLSLGRDGWVVAGSDDGKAFIWDTLTGLLMGAVDADDHIVNCVQPHPSMPLLATSGIASSWRLWGRRSPVSHPQARFIDTDRESLAVNIRVPSGAGHTPTLHPQALLGLMGSFQARDGPAADCVQQ